MNAETQQARRNQAPETIEVMMLRGYVPFGAEADSFEPNGKPASLKKEKKGTVVELPADEAKNLIRKGIAVRPDEATDNHLIQAGLKAAPVPDEDAD